MKRKTLAIVVALTLCFALLAGCGGKTNSVASVAPASTAPAESTAEPTSGEETTLGGGFSAAMITDVGGINDESFNQSAWSGMEQLKNEFNVDISFIESEKDADYAPNLERKSDEGASIIWAIGFLMRDASGEAANANPD